MYHSGTFRDVHAQLSFIRKFWGLDSSLVGLNGALEINPQVNVHDTVLPRVYLLINNLDGPSLRSEIAQTVLAQLAQIPYIHIIATVDHILAPLCKREETTHRENEYKSSEPRK